MVAAIDAVTDSGLDFSKEEPFRCGVILGSGIGGLHEIETQVERLLHKGPDKVSAFTIPKLMVNAASGQVSIQYGLRGPNSAVATACASATNAIGDAFKAIQYDDADVMITGGTEAAITPMGIGGFANMRALSERNDDPPRASRPFDRDRDGFVLSEGAGMLVFEELEHAKRARRADLRRGARLRRQRRRRPHHPARRRRHRRGPGHGAGPGATASSTRRTIGYINAHGTSTPLGDPAETHAIKTRLRRARPEAERLEHQEPVGPPAGGQRRRGTGSDRAGAARQHDSAHDQSGQSRSEVRSGLHAPIDPASGGWTRPCRTASASAATMPRSSSAVCGNSGPCPAPLSPRVATRGPADALRGRVPTSLAPKSGGFYTSPPLSSEPRGSLGHAWPAGRTRSFHFGRQEAEQMSARLFQAAAIVLLMVQWSAAQTAPAHFRRRRRGRSDAAGRLVDHRHRPAHLAQPGAGTPAPPMQQRTDPAAHAAFAHARSRA